MATRRVSKLVIAAGLGLAVLLAAAATAWRVRVAAQPPRAPTLEQFARLQREFTGAADLRLVSITVDPAHDTPEVPRLGPRPAWASHGSKGLVRHSARAVLVDRAARIRAYHLATGAESMKSLRANLRRLLAEAVPAGTPR